MQEGVARLAEAGILIYAVAGNHDTLALPRLAGLIEEFTLGTKDLDSAIRSITNPNTLLFVHPNVVGKSELARCCTRFPPGEKQSAIRSEFVYLCVAVTIAYIDFT